MAAGSTKNDIALDSANSIRKKTEISTKVLDEEIMLDDLDLKGPQHRWHRLNNATEHAVVPDGWLLDKDSR